jgi:hypothetical protein
MSEITSDTNDKDASVNSAGFSTSKESNETQNKVLNLKFKI